MSRTQVPCHGCGARFEHIDGPVHAYMDSSPGCWAAYGAVLEREYSNPILLRTHRLSVDAYAVQHPGQPSRQSIQSVGLHLLRLILLLEHGLSTESANDAMLHLGRYKHVFFWLEPPASRGSVTVADVVQCQTTEDHARAVQAWARSALSQWSIHHKTLEQWRREIFERTVTPAGATGRRASRQPGNERRANPPPA